MQWNEISICVKNGLEKDKKKNNNMPSIKKSVAINFVALDIKSFSNWFFNYNL